MDSLRSPEGRALKKARLELTCPICLSLPTAPPYALPCGHLFCGRCLLTLVNVADDRGAHVACPSCRARVRGRPVRVRAVEGAVAALTAVTDSQDDCGGGQGGGGGDDAGAAAALAAVPAPPRPWTDTDASRLASYFGHDDGDETGDSDGSDGDDDDGDGDGGELEFVRMSTADRLRLTAGSAGDPSLQDELNSAAAAAIVYPDAAGMLLAVYMAADYAFAEQGVEFNVGVMAAAVRAGARATGVGPAQVAAHMLAAASAAASDAPAAARNAADNVVAALRGATAGDNVDGLVAALVSGPGESRAGRLLAAEVNMKIAAVGGIVAQTAEARLVAAAAEATAAAVGVVVRGAGAPPSDDDVEGGDAAPPPSGGGGGDAPGGGGGDAPGGGGGDAPGGGGGGSGDAQGGGDSRQGGSGSGDDAPPPGGRGQGVSEMILDRTAVILEALQAADGEIAARWAAIEGARLGADADAERRAHAEFTQIVRQRMANPEFARRIMARVRAVVAARGNRV